MSSDLLSAIRFLFSESWRFFTETTIPGTNFSVAALAISLVLADLGILFVRWILGSGESKSKGE